MKISTVRSIPKLRTPYLTYQRSLVLRYLLAHGDATLDELRSIGIKNPSATIHGLRCGGLKNCIKSVPAHAKEVLFGDDSYLIDAPFKYAIDTAFVQRGYGDE